MNGAGFKSLFEQLPGMWYRSEANKTISYVSPGCFKLTGYYPEYFIGNRFDLITGLASHDHKEQVAAYHAHPRGNEDHNTLEYRIICCDGNIKWVKETICSSYDDVNGLLYTEGYIAEIPLKERNNNAVNDTAFFQNFLKKIPDRIVKVQIRESRLFLYDLNTGGGSLLPAANDLYALLPEKTADAFVKSATEVIASGNPGTLEFEVKEPGGEQYYLESRFVKNSEDEIIAIIRDMTHLITGTEKLKAEREFYKDIINNVNADIAVLDQENKYQLINHAAMRNAELRKWMIGKSDLEYTRLRNKNEAVVEARLRMYKLVDELKQPVEWIEELEDEKGNKRFFVRTLKPFEKASSGYKVGYGIDITALKVIQDELLRREHLLAFSHKLVKTGYWVYYPVTNKYEWSDGMYDILEVSRNEFSPSPEIYYNFIHTDDKGTLKQYLKLLQQGRAPQSEEYRIVTGTGTVKYIKEQSSAKRADTEEYIFGVIQDISGVKKSIEERERLILEINNKYNDLKQFSYIISHNLRSPVANILGMSSLLGMDLSEEEKAQLYDDILHSAQSIDTVIKDLNDVLAARAAASEKKESLSFSEIIDSVCHDLREQIQGSDAVVAVNIDIGADQVYSIRSYMHSIFYNLISNSIKYKASDRVPEIIIMIKSDGDKSYISISDNGIGINLKAYEKQLFGLYKRFTTSKEGRGMGLHMTKTQVESLNGTISVESKVGVGTTFNIELKH